MLVNGIVRHFLIVRHHNVGISQTTADLCSTYFYKFYLSHSMEGTILLLLIDYFSSFLFFQIEHNNDLSTPNQHGIFTGRHIGRLQTCLIDCGWRILDTLSLLSLNFKHAHTHTQSVSMKIKKKK